MARLLAGLVLVASVAACGGKTTGDPPGAPPASADSGMLADATIDVADAADTEDTTDVSDGVRDVALPVDGGSASVAELATGGAHTCARKTDGMVLCWGRNSEGQVGDGTWTTPRASPTSVLVSEGGVALRDVAGIAAGGAHSCAHKIDGTVLCWGFNGHGQVGDGALGDRLLPIPVLVSPGGAALTGVSELAASNEHTCALKTDSTVLCWGDNVDGDLGDGTWTMRPSPTPVLVAPGGAAVSGVVEIAVSANHSCARDTDGAVLCWGDNKFGQLGDGTTTTRPSPTLVLVAPGDAALTDVAEIAAGGAHTCARKTDSTVLCWGWGQIVDGTMAPRPSPRPVLVSPGGAPLSGVAEIAAGGGHTCARKTDGTVLCWGGNEYGQIGDGTTSSTTPRVSPTLVLVSPGGAALTDVAEIAAGYIHTCVRKTDGAVLCWGDNSNGQIGDGTTSTTPRTTPTLVKL